MLEIDRKHVRTIQLWIEMIAIANNKQSSPHQLKKIKTFAFVAWEAIEKKLSAIKTHTHFH